MKAKLYLSTVLVKRALASQPKVTALSILLIALTPLGVIASSPNAAEIPAIAIAVIALGWVSLSVGNPVRIKLNTYLWLNGGRWGTRVILVMIHTLILGIAGVITGTILGVVVASIESTIWPRVGVTLVELEGVAISSIAGTILVGLASSLQYLKRPRLTSLSGLEVRRKRHILHWVTVLASPVLLYCAIATTASWSNTFRYLNASLLLLSPLLIIAIFGMTSFALKLLSVPKKKMTGPAWFTMRRLGRDNGQVGTLAGVMAVFVAYCAIGLIFSASFTERSAIAQASFSNGSEPAWAIASGNSDSTPLSVSSALSGDQLVVRNNGDRWLLVGSILAYLLLVVGVSSSLGAATRSEEIELLTLQGADPVWREKTNILETGMMTTTAVVVGISVATVSTALGFYLYNVGTRLSDAGMVHQWQICFTSCTQPKPAPYPPVPFSFPVMELAVLAVMLPTLATLISAALARRTKDLDIGQRAENTSPI